MDYSSFLKCNESIFETECFVLNQMLDLYEKELDIAEYFYQHDLPMRNLIITEAETKPVEPASSTTTSSIEDATNPQSPSPSPTSTPQPKPETTVQSPAPAPQPTSKPEAPVEQPHQTPETVPQKPQSNPVKEEPKPQQQSQNDNKNKEDDRNIFQKIWDGICKLVKLIGQAFKNFFGTFGKKNEQVQKLQETLNTMDEQTLNKVNKYFDELQGSTTTNHEESYYSFLSDEDSFYDEASIVSSALDIKSKVSNGKTLIKTVMQGIIAKKTIKEVITDAAMGPGKGFLIDIFSQGLKIGPSKVVHIALSPVILANPIVGVGVDIILGYLVGKVGSGIGEKLTDIFKRQPGEITPKTLPSIGSLINSADDLIKTAQSFKEIIYGYMSNVGDQVKAQGSYLVHTNVNKTGEDTLNKLKKWISDISAHNANGQGNIVNFDVNTPGPRVNELDRTSAKDVTQMNADQLTIIIDCLIASKTWDYSNQSTTFGQKMKETQDTYDNINTLLNNDRLRTNRVNQIGLDAEGTFRTNFNILKQHGQNCLDFVTSVEKVKKCADQVVDLYSVLLGVILAAIKLDSDTSNDKYLEKTMNANSELNGVSAHTGRSSNSLLTTAANNEATHDPNTALSPDQQNDVKQDIHNHLTANNIAKGEHLRNATKTLNRIGNTKIW